MKPTNILSFYKGKLLRDIKKNRLLPLYATRASIDSSEWIDEPYSLGELVWSQGFIARENTSDTQHIITSITLEDGRKIDVCMIVSWIKNSP